MDVGLAMILRLRGRQTDTNAYGSQGELDMEIDSSHALHHPLEKPAEHIARTAVLTRPSARLPNPEIEPVDLFPAGVLGEFAYGPRAASGLFFSGFPRMLKSRQVEAANGLNFGFWYFVAS